MNIIDIILQIGGGWHAGVCPNALDAGSPLRQAAGATAGVRTSSGGARTCAGTVAKKMRSCWLKLTRHRLHPGAVQALAAAVLVPTARTRIRCKTLIPFLILRLQQQ